MFDIEFSFLVVRAYNLELYCERGLCSCQRLCQKERESSLLIFHLISGRTHSTPLMIDLHGAFELLNLSLVGIFSICDCSYFAMITHFQRGFFYSQNLLSHLHKRAKFVLIALFIPRPPLLMGDVTIDHLMRCMFFFSYVFLHRKFLHIFSTSL